MSFNYKLYRFVAAAAVVFATYRIGSEFIEKGDC